MFADLEGRVACFPTYQGAAFVSALESLNKLKLISSNCSSSVGKFFSRKSCFGDRKSKYCGTDFVGDMGALECLTNVGDVAFMNLETFKNLTGKLDMNNTNRQSFSKLFFNDVFLKYQSREIS